MLTPHADSAVRFRLRSKFIAAAAFLVLIVAVIIVLIEQFNMRRTIIRQTATQGASIADTIEATAGYYVIFGLTDDLKGIIDDLRRNPTIEYADFLAADGKILAATDPKKIPSVFIGRVPGRVPANTVLSRDIGGDLHLSTRPYFESSADASSKTGRPSGFVRIAVNEREAAEAVSRAMRMNIAVVLLALAVGITLAAFASQLIVRPIQNLETVAGEISRGDLTKRAAIVSRDELGGLASSFNAMAINLEKTVGKVVQSQSKLHDVVGTIGSRAETVNAKADEQRVVLDETYYSIDRLNSGIRKISENVESLSASSEETSSSILEMVASIEEVARHTDSLFNSVEDTASATQEMVTSIAEVDQNMDFLRNFVTETSASMNEMSASINQVGGNAQRSYDLAVAVADAAESGMKSVRETMEGMEQIRQAVLAADAVVSKLGDRSVEIGKILNVIDDVAEQTNLLALNAAILAAQAGEHGKGFSVVAAEIRDLSERTATSTKEIGGLIRAVQEEVGNALASMAQGSSLVEHGVDLAHEAGKALNNILDSASKSSDMGKEIANATREQAAGSLTVTKSIERVQDMVRQINSATTQQAAGSSHIMQAVEAMRDATKYVRQATVEQKSGSGMISKAAERMIDMVHEIFEVSTNQASESEKIVQTMERVRGIAEANRRSAGDLAETVTLLNGAIAELEEEVRRFRTRA